MSLAFFKLLRFVCTVVALLARPKIKFFFRLFIFLIYCPFQACSIKLFLISQCLFRFCKLFWLKIIFVQFSLNVNKINTNFLKNNPFEFPSRCQFHQRSTYSFYTCRSQKYQTTLPIWLSFFCAFGICKCKSCT